MSGVYFKLVMVLNTIYPKFLDSDSIYIGENPTEKQKYHKWLYDKYTNNK